MPNILSLSFVELIGKVYFSYVAKWKLLFFASNLECDCHKKSASWVSPQKSCEASENANSQAKVVKSCKFQQAKLNLRVKDMLLHFVFFNF